MNIAYFAKGVGSGAIGYSARGIGFSMEKVGAGIEFVGRKTKEGGIALGEFGKKHTDMSSLYFKASSTSDATKFSDDEFQKLGFSEKEIAEIRKSYTEQPKQAEAPKAETKAETPKTEPAQAESKKEDKPAEGETVEVTAEEAASMLV